VVGRRPVRRSGPSPSGPDGRLDATAPPQGVQIPRQNVDPVWSLQPWPVQLTFHGEDYEIPAIPAVDWLGYLMQESPDLDGLVEDLLPEAEDLLYEMTLDLEELFEVVLETIATVAARPWWIALRLIQVARANWHIVGPDMLSRGADPGVLSLAGWLDVVLVSILNNMDPKDTTMFVLRLEASPIQVAPDNDELPALEMDSRFFQSMSD
jgi:hypothetical protein